MVWKNQSSCNGTNDALETAYTLVTKKKLNLLKIVNKDGHLDDQLNIPYVDGTFKNYPTVLAALNSSKFISYSFRTN